MGQVLGDMTHGEGSTMPSTRSASRFSTLVAFVFVAGILAHGLLPLTDYVLWDGWWVSKDLGSSRGPVVLRRLLNEVGRPLDMWFYLSLRWLGGDIVAWAKWLGAAAWIGTAVCMRTVLQRIAGLSDVVATAVAVLVVALPIFDLLGELALWMNTACVLLFWLAWVLVSRMPELVGWRSIAARAAALGLFFVSFNLNSNLVMFYAVAAVLVGLRLPDMWLATLVSRMPREVIRHADFLALPIVFWLWKTLFTPTSGFYATGYNQPSLAPGRLAAGYSGMTIDFVFRGLIELLSSSTWIAAAVVAAIAATAVMQRFPLPEPVVERPARLGLRLLGWGLFLLLAAAFPYIVVGQSLASEGWLTRNCILCPLPVAMITCGLLIVVNRWWLSQYPKAWLAGVAAIVTLSVGGCIHNYLAYQALGAKQWSIRSRLVEIIHDYDAAVVQLRDYYQFPRTIPYYPPLIWTYLASGTDALPKTFVIETALQFPDQIVRDANGEQRRVVPQLPLSSADVDQAITQTTMPYALQLVPRTGPQKLVTIMPGKHGNNGVSLGIRYLWLKWFDRAKVGEFLEALTESQAFDLPRIGG
jgi:hypothetical protein